MNHRIVVWSVGILMLLGVTAAPAQPMPGQIIVDPHHPAWLTRKGDSTSFFMAGPGSPEGFLYRGKRAKDGTRKGGEQRQLIEKLGRTGANSLYLIAVRSQGGDGSPNENPFLDPSDPTSGLNQKILDQWEAWFTAMDKAGVVIYFIFYDDMATPFGEAGRAIPDGGTEEQFVRELVNHFEHHKNLIWTVAEEYSEANSKANVRRIAQIITEADEHDHVIGVHQRDGRRFDFPDAPNIDQFAIQRNIAGSGSINREVAAASDMAGGRYNLNMSESNQHYDPDDPDRAATRRYSWAAAMGGAYVMVLGMDVAATPEKILEDHGRIVHFFEQTSLGELVPHNELATFSTKEVLANPGETYILYSDVAASRLTLKHLPAGQYDLYWFDPVDGDAVRRAETVEKDGRHHFSKPSTIGREAALQVSRSDRKAAPGAGVKEK